MEALFVVDGTPISKRVATYVAESSNSEIESQITQSPREVARQLGAAIDDTGILESRDLLSSNAVAGVHVRGAFDPGNLSVDTPSGFLPIPLEGATIAARLALLTMVSGVGAQPVSYGSENDGELFVNLSPMPGEGRAAERGPSAKALSA